MRSDATAVVIGHLGADARVNTTPTGKTVASLSIAINRRKGEVKTTLWVKADVWQPHPDLLAQLKKGAYVRVRGDMYPDDYVSKKDGAQVKGFILASANAIILAAANEGGSAPIDPDEMSAAAAAAPAAGNDDLDELPF